jgi:uncharacterized membrane protein YkvA (DUF1232 family)
MVQSIAFWETRMSLKIDLELSDEDLQYFRGAMDSAWDRNAARPDNEILEEARRLLQEANRHNAPEYVRKRFADLGTLIDMLGDPEWPLEEDDRRRIVVAVSYFADPADVIPDKIPGLGFLDDALMAELVIRELEHELRGYREFCEYRANEQTYRRKEHVSREDWLAAKRRQIYLRIKRRRAERFRHATDEHPTLPILRYHY